MHNYRAERGAKRLQPLPLLRVSYCELLLMRFLSLFFVSCVTRRSEIVLYSYTQLIRDKKANQCFLNFISLVLSCSFLTVIGLPCWKRFSGELSRKRVSGVSPGAAAWPPKEGAAPGRGGCAQRRYCSWGATLLPCLLSWGKRVDF